MDPSLEQTADWINASFRRYGLTHDVVDVEGMDMQARLVLVNSDDTGAMHNLAHTLDYLCTLGEQADGQLRLF
jgi:hypothetical protein